MRPRRWIPLLLATALAPSGCDEPPSHPPDAVPSAPAETTAAAADAPATASAAAAAPSEPAPTPPDVAAAPADALRTPSGLASKVLRKGTGVDKPGPKDRVHVHYTGWKKDGTRFDTTAGRGKPAELGVEGVIAGWTEGLQLMVVGEQRRFWIPTKLAYGDRPQMGAPAGDLVFDVELVAILPPPEVPEDLVKPPADAKKTPSGLTYRVLTQGSGTRHPTAKSRVRVQYAGWTKDGKLFDSSVAKGQPMTFPLEGVIQGWKEGLPLMVEGDKWRLWIPADLAYGERPTKAGVPAGDLVFDVELLAIL
jgi:peptidylprolyl isomerase